MVGHRAAELTEDEQRSHFSLWAMLGAPLMAKVRLASSDGRIWAKPLADSSVAVALFNSGGVPADIATTAAAVGLPPAICYTLRDLWAGRNATTTGDIIATSVAPHAVRLVRVATQ